MEATEEKKGIGGRDMFIIPGADSSTVVVSSVFGGPIRIQRNDDPAIFIDPDSFNQLVEWLKSWEYI